MSSAVLILLSVCLFLSLERCLRVSPVDATLTKVRCGETYDYWSESCGAIGSAASRACSDGGHLIDSTSCTTHFHPHSSACGLMNLGCRSKCRIEATACSGGKLSFTSEAYTVSSNSPQVSVAVRRYDGSDTEASVRLHIHTQKLRTSPEASLWHSTFILKWAADDVSTKHFPLQISDVRDEGNISIWLRDPVGAEIGAIENALVIIKPAEQEEAGFLDFEKCEYEVDEGEGKVTIGVKRSGGAKGRASVRLQHVGGSATPVGDFVRFDHVVLVWEDSETGVKEYTIILPDDKSMEPDETIEISLVDHEGATMGDFCSLAVVTVRNDDFGDDSYADVTVKKLKELLHFDETLNPTDMYSFLSAFQSRTYAAGETILKQGEPGTEFYVIESGVCDVFVTSAISNETERVAVLGAGDNFGAIQLLYGTNRGSTVVARTVSLLWLVDQATFKRYQLSRPELHQKFEFQMLQNVLRSTDLKPPVILFPGLASSRLLAWREKQCRGFGINVGDVVWLSVEKILQTLTTDSRCWLECLALGPDQTDAPDCKLRAAEGTSALTELAPGVFTGNPTTIFGIVIKTLATELLYDIRSIVALPYDWRLSPDVLQSRDRFFSSVKDKIQFAVAHTRHPAIVMAHSQGNFIFRYFLDWLELTYPDTWRNWVDENLWTYIGLGAPLLGAHEPLRGLISGLNMGLPVSDLQAKTLAHSFGCMNWFLPQEDSRVQEKLQRATQHAQESREKQRSAFKQKASPEEQQFAKEHVDDLPVILKQIISYDFLDGTMKNFDSRSVISGEMYQYLAQKTNDTRYLSLLAKLQTHYLHKKPNLFAAPPKRPPIRHVIMMYGVDLPTDVGFHYTQVADSAEPRLDVTVFEDKGGVYGIKKRSIFMSLEPITSSMSKSSRDHRYFEAEYLGKRNVFGRSGDKTVPYSSLSWANTWHPSEPNVTVVPSRKIEYYQHPIGRWGEEHVISLMNRVDPEYTRYSSSHVEDGRTCTTTVLEVSGLGHREIVKESFTMKLLFQELFTKIADELKNGEPLIAPLSWTKGVYERKKLQKLSPIASESVGEIKEFQKQEKQRGVSPKKKTEEEIWIDLSNAIRDELIENPEYVKEVAQDVSEEDYPKDEL